MLACRQIWSDLLKSEHGMTLWPGVDSSPHGGRNYELVVGRWVGNATLPDVQYSISVVEALYESLCLLIRLN